MIDLSQSSAIVFGGASGLGAATVERLRAGGAAVEVADLNAPAPCDVTDETQVQAAIDRAVAQAPLRVSVCCAGLGTPAKVLGRQGPLPLERYAQIINVNLIGTFNALRLAAAAMSYNEPDDDGQRGVIVNTASIAAFDGQIGQPAYASSKAGVVGLTLPAARELATIGVRVVTIAPGLFKTPMMESIPQTAQDALAASVPFPARLGHPSEYADLVAFVVGNTMVNGETIRLDGTLRMAPK